MNNLKRCFYLLVPITIGIAIGFSSCNNSSEIIPPLPQIVYKQPVVLPLKFSGEKKFNWDTIKSVKVNPQVEKFDIDKLPAKAYDTVGFKPLTYPVEEKKFNYNALPSKRLDIDKLPSSPLKFKTYLLPPPKLIKAGLPVLKNAYKSIYEFGAAQGLLGYGFTCSLTGRDGFVWFVTSKGLYRYDGENLLLYMPAPLESLVYSMLQDHLGRIWMGGLDGVLRVFDPANGILKKAMLARGFLGNQTAYMTMDGQQRIWFTNWSAGVNIIDTKTLTFKTLDQAQGLHFKHGTRGIIRDNNGNIWIGTGGHGVNIIDVKHKEVKYLDGVHGLKSDSAGRMFCDRAGRIWIEHAGDINVLNPAGNTIEYIKAQYRSSEILSFFQDNRGRVWVGARNSGIVIIDLEKRLAMHLTPADGLSSGDILNINQDRQGQLWIAGWNGLNMIGNSSAVVKQIGKEYVGALMQDERGLIWRSRWNGGFDILDVNSKTTRYLSTQQGLSNDTVNCNKVINGKIFIGTYADLDIIDEAKKTITHLHPDLRVLETGKTGLVWIGRNQGIDVYNPVNKMIKHIGELQGLSSEVIVDMVADQDNNLWISTYTGINLINTKTGSIKYIKNLPGLNEGALLVIDNNGNVWMGTSKGIYKVDLKNKTATSFYADQGLFYEGLYSLLQNNGRIYAGTEWGVARITPPTGSKRWQVESFGAAYGLIKTDLSNAQSDMIGKDGLYWWGDEGITVSDFSKKDTYAPPAYIMGISVMDKPAYFVDPPKLNLPAADTLRAYNKNTHYVKGETPVNTGYAFHSGLSWDKVNGPYNMPVDLQLPYDQNFIRIQYGSLNVARHDTARYRYILVGADKKWSDETSLNTSVNYINLSPGKYTFAVVGRNLNNVWSKPAIFSFTINPPWWQTWWAYILYVCLFAGTVWGFVYVRSLQLIKEKRILEHKVQIRTEEVLQQKEEITSQRDNLEKAFSELKLTQTQLIQSEKMASLGELTAGIAHEIQNPLNFVNNFSEVNRDLLFEMKQEINKGNLDEVKAIANDIIDNEEKISHHGKRADSIVKGMLEHSRSRSGQKEPTDINVMADEFMRLSYHGLRAKDKTFNAELITHFDDTLPKINVVQQDIGRVLLNLFNNAFYTVLQKSKTAGKEYKPKVEVTTFTPPSGGLGVKVKDNGAGIPDPIKEKIMQPFFTTKPTGEGTGLGLSLTYDMVVKGHGGSINVNSKEGEGSEFVIILPVG